MKRGARFAAVHRYLLSSEREEYRRRAQGIAWRGPRARERDRGDQKVRSTRALVNRFEKNNSVDFHCACAIDAAALDETCDLVNVPRRRTIGRERRDA